MEASGYGSGVTTRAGMACVPARVCIASCLASLSARIASLAALASAAAACLLPSPSHTHSACGSGDALCPVDGEGVVLVWVAGTAMPVRLLLSSPLVGSLVPPPPPSPPHDQSLLLASLTHAQEEMVSAWHHVSVHALPSVFARLALYCCAVGATAAAPLCPHHALALTAAPSLTHITACVTALAQAAAGLAALCDSVCEAIGSEVASGEAAPVSPSAPRAKGVSGLMLALHSLKECYDR